MAVHEECESYVPLRGYHIYKEIWNSAVGEHLICEKETLNPTDRYTVAVMKTVSSGVIIGHLPRVLLE